MAYIDFIALKERVSIMDALGFLGITGLKQRSNGQLRGVCPICEGKGDDKFVVTPDKNLYNCFCGCGGGDIIKLVASVKRIGTMDAAREIAAHFDDKQSSPAVATVPQNEKPASKQAIESQGPLKPLDYLTTDHPAIEALGLSVVACNALGMGFAPKGMMRGRVVIPLRTPDGLLVGYCGLATKEDMAPLMLFPKNLDQMVDAPVQAEKPKQEPDELRKLFRVVA